MIVGDAHAQAAGFYWDARPALLLGVLETFNCLGSKPHAHKRFVVVKQQQARFGIAFQLQAHFHLISAIYHTAGEW